MTYYKLENGALKQCASVEKINGVWVSNPTVEQRNSIGAYPRSDESFAPPKCDEGFHAVADGYELVDNKWVRKWRIEPIVHMVEDYERAMEDYIRSVRIERGYTTREPSDYINSAVPRWRQDAEDYIAFRDAVMVYALTIINEYTATGNAPSLEEFKAGFPKIEWSYDIGDET
jgi:hypothetical protein